MVVYKLFFQNLCLVKWPKSTKRFLLSLYRTSQMKFKKGHHIKFQSNGQNKHYFFGHFNFCLAYSRKNLVYKVVAFLRCFFALSFALHSYIYLILDSKRELSAKSFHVIAVEKFFGII